MEPIINTIYNGTNRVFEVSRQVQIVEKTLAQILSKKVFDSVRKASFALYLTIVVNPDEDLIRQSKKCDNGIFIHVFPELEQDHDIYSLCYRITTMSIPAGMPECVIVIGLSEYRQEGHSSLKQQKKEEGEQPVYCSVDPKWKIEDIVLLDDVKKRLERAISVIKNKDIIMNEFEYFRVDKSMKSVICFYGPPGTGKTITAQAVASMLGKKIIMSSYAQIESKYVGDGAKNLRAIFKSAEEQDAVLFMDEADSFLSKRIESTSSSSDKHYNRMSNELFQLLEEHNGCIVFATNLLTDLDEAFKSRIVDSIYFPLPDENTRKDILKKMVKASIFNEVFSDGRNMENWLEITEGFSGRDIRKSLLLTYADAAGLLHETGSASFKWSYELFKTGFNDVKNSFEEDTQEIPLDAVEEFKNELNFKRKQLDLAKHAILVDGEEYDDREFHLLNEMSLMLISKNTSKEDIKPKFKLTEICNDVRDDNQKLTLIDTAVRVVTVDGEYSENERVFISKLCHLLCFDDVFVDNLHKYASSMANSYKIWIDGLTK